MNREEKTVEYLRAYKNKDVARMLGGMYDLLNNKFPSSGYDIDPTISSEGFHMKLQGTEYTLNFSGDNPMKFNLKVKLTKKRDDLEEKLEESRISNGQLNKTKYLADQRINSKGKNAKISCRLKTIPKNQKDIVKCCDQIWGDIVKRTMEGIQA